MASSACRRRASAAEQSAWSYSLTAESAPVKEEPEWGECGVSDAAAAEGLYADHEVEDEMVFGPVMVQQQDIAISMQNAPSRMKEGFCKPKPEGGTETATRTCPRDKPCKIGVRRTTPTLFSCSSCNKKFITQAFLHKHMQTHNEKSLEPVADVAESKPDYGHRTLCKSTERHRPWSCLVRFERCPVERNVVSSAELKPADEAGPAAEETARKSLAPRMHRPSTLPPGRI